MNKSLFLRSHFIVLRMRESPNDLGQLLRGKVRCNFVGSVFDSPPNILEVLGLEDVKCLGDSCQMRGVSLRNFLNEIVLVVSKHLVQFFSRIYSVNAELLGSEGGKHEQDVDHLRAAQLQRCFVVD